MAGLPCKAETCYRIGLVRQTKKKQNKKKGGGGERDRCIWTAETLPAVYNVHTQADCFYYVSLTVSKS
jgi:hypothetical protein